MDSKQEEKFIQLINQGIQEVVIPAMASMEQKLKSEFRKEIKASEGRIRNEVNKRFDEVNQKLDRLDRRDARLADDQVDLRTRLRRVEKMIFKEVD